MGKPKKANRDLEDDFEKNDIDLEDAGNKVTEDNDKDEQRVSAKTDRKKKNKKKQKDEDRDDDNEPEIKSLAFKANSDSDEEENLPQPAKKGKNKKKGISSFALLANMDDESDDNSLSDKQSDDELENSKKETVVVQKTKKKEKIEKPKKEKPKKQEDADIDNILADLEKPIQGDKKKKKKKKGDVEDENNGEMDVDTPTQEVEITESKVVSMDDLEAEFEDDKKKRKKGKKKGKEEEIPEEKENEEVVAESKVVSMDDLEAEFEDDKKKRKKGKKKGKEEEIPEEKDEEDEEDNEEGNDGEKSVKTAAQKKKEKKEREKQAKREEKQKQWEKEQAKKEREALKAAASANDKSKEDTMPEAKAAEEKKVKSKKDEQEKGSAHEATPEAGEEEEGKEKDGKKKKKKKGDKEEKKDEKAKPKNKQIAALKEALRLQQEEEERAKKEEERLIREEEERIKRLEQEMKEREEQKKLRKKEKKEREAQLRKEGKLLTEKQKQEKMKLEQMLATMKLSGADIEIAPRASPDTTTTKKRIVYGKKKKPTGKEKSPTETTPTEETPSVEMKESPETEVKVEEVKKTEVEEVKDEWDAESEEESEDAETEDSKTESSSATAVKPASKKVEEEEEEDESDDSDSEEDEDESSEESDESESDSEDEKSPTERAKEKIQKRIEKAEKARSLDHLRAPVVCVLGHVDTGKTKILDKLRRTNVQDGEAGGITQQIGATNVPRDALIEKTKMCKEFAKQELKIPGLLIIDTPGHESFSNLRQRGSSLCDIAILVIDIMHGLEPQTLESIKLLKDSRTPFLVALNKIDRLYQWKCQPMLDVQNTLKKQSAHTRAEFDERMEHVKLQLAEEGLNSAIFYENKNPREYVSLVPTSAHTGDGMGNLVALVCELCQTMLAKRLMYSAALQATVMEVKAITGMGTTIDVILINGSLNEGDTVVLAGTEGPIVTQIRGLLMPQPMKELRVKNQYEHHKTVVAAQGVKINAKEMEKCLAGLPMYVAHDNDEKEYYKEEVAKALKDTLESIKVQERGVFVQASTLGSLEALLEFLRTSKIPYAGINIGPVHKKDIMKASVMLEHDSQYAVILAFDVKVEREAQELADNLGVRIFTAEIIYHLFDAFTKYREDEKRKKQEEFKNIAVFPCKLRILPQYIFNSRDPIVMGVQVEAGLVKEGTPICVPSKEFVEIGRISSLQLNHNEVDVARQGQEICVKIVPTSGEAPKMYGRHFEETDMLVSKISRESIDAVKDYFREEMTKPDWKLMVELKKQFNIL